MAGCAGETAGKVYWDWLLDGANYHLDTPIARSKAFMWRFLRGSKTPARPHNPPHTRTSAAYVCAQGARICVGARLLPCSPWQRPALHVRRVVVCARVQLHHSPLHHQKPVLCCHTAHAACTGRATVARQSRRRTAAWCTCPAGVPGPRRRPRSGSCSTGSHTARRTVSTASSIASRVSPTVASRQSCSIVIDDTAFAVACPHERARVNPPLT